MAWIKTVINKELLNNGYKVRRCASSEEIDYNSSVAILPVKMREDARRKLSSNSKLQVRTIDDFVPMTIIKNENTNKFYLVVSRDKNIVELVNINNMADAFYFELESETCPFKYYRILSKEEYNIYLSKLKELKEIAAGFEKI